MTKLTPEQQVDILWKALAAPDYWISVNNIGQITMYASDKVTVPSPKSVFSGSRDSVIEQLLALQVAERLDGKPIAEPEISDQFNLS